MTTVKKPAPDPAADPRRPAFRIHAKALKAALADLAGAVAARDTLPILSCVRLAVADGRLTLTATDLDIWATRTLATDDRQANSEEWRGGIRPFTLCAPFKPLQAVIGGFDPDAMVTLEAQDNGRVAVTAGRSRFRLPTLPVDDFPALAPTVWEHSFTMAASALDDVLAAVSHAISTEDVRYYLNGVYWHVDGLDLRAVATDGHRIARCAFDAPEGALSFPPVIMARATAALLAKVLPKAGDGARIEIMAKADGRALGFTLPCPDDGELEIHAKTIDGTFPDYTRVIPENPPLHLILNREALLAALARVSVLAGAKDRAVKLESEGDSLLLSVTSPELGEASEPVPLAYLGEPITWGFNGAYLRDALKALASETVRLMLTDPAAPVRIEGVSGDEPARLVQVVMPIRV